MALDEFDQEDCEREQELIYRFLDMIWKMACSILAGEEILGEVHLVHRKFLIFLDRHYASSILWCMCVRGFRYVYHVFTLGISGPPSS